MRQHGLNGGIVRTGFGCLLAALSCMAGCDSKAEVQQGVSVYQIVCTTGMVSDIVQRVAADKAHVEGLMGTGVDPHLYKPTRTDVAKILNADMIFYSGLMLEGRMTDTFMKAGREQKPVYAVTEEIEESYLMEPPSFAGHWDPHVWMDVMAWRECVEVIGSALAKQDPQNAVYYQSNVAAYLTELSALDQYVRGVVASIPAKRRVLITAHDAFNYFGRAYDIEVLGIQGISTESEAGLDDINRLVDRLVAEKIRAVFVESSVSDKNVKALIEGAAARGHSVKIGGRLFSDAMGVAGSYEGTYIGMLDHNATTIALALGGSAPADGMNGKLSHGKI